MNAESYRPGGVLLLDVGSTSVKGAVLDGPGGVVLEEEQAPAPPAALATRTRHEVDPEAVLRAVEDVAGRLVGRLPQPPAAAMMSTQMHTCLLTDGDSRPVSPLITWQDDRLLETGEDGRRHLDRLLAADEMGAWVRSGMAHRPGVGGANLGLWLREHPGAARRGLRVHTLASYLVSALGGPYATGLSNAAALGLVDLARGEWSAGLLALHGLTDCELPGILPEPAASGTIRLVDVELTWLGDVGDHQASVVGSGGLAEDEVAISLGTAGIAARLADAPHADPRVDSRPYLGGRYLLAVSRQPGGALAADFAELLGDVAGTLGPARPSAAEVWRDLAGLSSRELPATRLGVGEAAAGSRELSFSGVRPVTAAADMYGAFLHHYVQAYRECVDLLFTGAAPPRRLKLNGGFAARNPDLRAVLAQSLDLDIHDTPPGDLALLGLRELTVAATFGRQYV